MIGWRVLHAAHGDHAVAIALQTVAGRTENLVTLFAALEKVEVHRQGKIVRILRYVEFIVRQRAARQGIFHQRALRAAVFKEGRRRKRPALRLASHVLPEIFATRAENQASRGANSDEAARGASAVPTKGNKLQGPPTRCKEFSRRLVPKNWNDT